MNNSRNNDEQSLMVVLGKGFLGMHIANQLRQKGHAVRVIDRSSCDLMDPVQVSEVLSAIPGKVSFFLPAAVTRLRSNDKLSFDQNYKIVRNVLNALPTYTQHFVFFSTIDVYGLAPALPVQESTALEPDDHYAMSKVVAEFLVRKESESKGISWTIFRLSGIYGQGDEGKSTIHRMADSALKNGEIVLTGNPSIERDFVWVKDVAHLAERAVLESVTGCFNEATGRSLTIAETAAAVAYAVSPEVKVLRHGITENTRALRLRFDVTKLRNAFPGFKMTSLEEGLAEYVQYLRTSE